MLMLAWGKSALEAVFALLLCVPVYLLVKFSRLHKRWAKRGIASHETNLLLHAWFRLNHLSYTTVTSIYNQFINEKCVGLHHGLRPVLMVINTKLISGIFDNVGSKFSRLSHTDRRLRLVLEKGELDAEEMERAVDDEESRVSRLLAGERSAELFDSAFECSNELRMSMEARAHEAGVVNIVEELTRLKVDIVGMSFFGLPLGKIRHPSYRFKENVDKLLTRPSLVEKTIRLVAKDSRRKQKTEMYDYFVQLYHDCLNGPLDSQSIHSNFPNLVHSDELLSVPESVTTEEIMGSILVFIQEHMERIHATLSFALYELAGSSEAQSNLFAEIQRTIESADGKISNEQLGTMEYLDRVVIETLRKYPVSGLLTTKCKEAYKTEQLEIEPGMDVILPVLAIHRDPHLYPKPESFDPERFAACEVHDASHPPLIAQQIKDIGGAYGVMVIKLAVFLLVRDYRFHWCKETPSSPVSFNQQASSCLKPLSSIPLQIISRTPDKGFFPHRSNRSG